MYEESGLRARDARSISGELARSNRARISRREPDVEPSSRSDKASDAESLFRAAKRTASNNGRKVETVHHADRLDLEQAFPDCDELYLDFVARG
jgi:hypothetical protein